MAVAQHIPVKTASFETITIDDGLSQGVISSITQDHFGFIWIGTKDGLNRYDGSKFVIYRHDVADTNSLADNYINSVFVDSKNRLWVVTTSSGLDLFNRETNNFIHFTHDEHDKLSINSNSGMEVREDYDGNLYFTTNKGLSIINVAKDKDGKESFTFNVIDDHIFPRLYAAPGGLTWINPDNDSLYRLTWRNNKPVKQPVSFITNFIKANPSAKHVSSFIYDSMNHCAYFLLIHYLLRYDVKTGIWLDMPGYDVMENNLNYCTLVDNAGYFWTAPGGEIYDTKNGTAIQLKSDDARQSQMLQGVWNSFKDRSGNIWMGTKGYGILKFNARAEKFHHTGTESISRITTTNDGRVLIVTQNNIAGVFDNTSGKYSDFIPNTSARELAGDNVIDNAIQDAAGNYWLSYNGFPFTLCNHSGEILKYINGIKLNTYHALYGALDKTIWLSCDDTLHCFESNGNQLTKYRLPYKGTYDYYALVQTIVQQNDSIFWLGTTNGLLQFNKNSATWKHYVNDPADKNSLSSNLIFSLCADASNPQRYLWIGTNGTGLNRLDIATGKFEHYSTKNGLPNDVVYGILNDDDGNVWISTNKGLCRFTPPSGTGGGIFQYYEAKDGLQSNEFNRYAYCKTKDGTLYFGGVNGFNYFNPRDLDKNNVPPNVVITDLKIGNKPVSIHDGKNILTKAIEMTDKIVLPYSDNMISFEFAALDFTQPSKNLYQYILDGFDHEWIQSGTVHSATYTNLDPGTYTFSVKGSNSDGVWNEKGTSIELVILPPWYMTWWFRTLVAIAIAVAAYSFYRYRLQQALKLQTIRNKIGSDLHDEIGSNLSSISIFSDVAKEETRGTAIGTVLSKISSYSHESMEAMSDIVWMINASNDRFENIINKMREFAVELIEAKKCSLQLNIDDRLNNIKLGMQERKNFWLIYKEALNNAAKYSNANNVGISMQAYNGSIELIVKDDGGGFDLHQFSSGNGLRNMQQRAALLKGKLQIISAPGEGTTVKLVFKN
jgi:ligand-binding sensor domain-containing protein